MRTRACGVTIYYQRTKVERVIVDLSAIDSDPWPRSWRLATDCISSPLRASTV